jgi:hypothetical protein
VRPPGIAANCMIKSLKGRLSQKATWTLCPHFYQPQLRPILVHPFSFLDLKNNSPWNFIICHSFSLEYQHWRQFYAIGATCRNSSVMGLLMARCFDSDCFGTFIVHSSIQWNIESKRNYVHVANLTKLETRFLSSSDHKFMNAFASYSADIFCEILVRVCMLSLSLHKTVTPSPCIRKIIDVCNHPSSRFTDDHLR